MLWIELIYWSMIKGDTVSFRYVVKEDVDVLLKWENDPANWRFSETPSFYSKDSMQQFVESTHDLFLNNQIRFMIDVNEGLVGCIDLFEFDPFHLRAGVGVLIDADHRGKGHAKKSLKLLQEYAFVQLHLKQLYCKINNSNEASLALFKACDFKLSGTFKSWINHNDQWEDIHFLQCFSQSY